MAQITAATKQAIHGRRLHGATQSITCPWFHTTRIKTTPSTQLVLLKSTLTSFFGKLLLLYLSGALQSNTPLMYGIIQARKNLTGQCQWKNSMAIHLICLHFDSSSMHQYGILSPQQIFLNISFVQTVLLALHGNTVMCSHIKSGPVMIQKESCSYKIFFNREQRTQPRPRP